MDIRWVKITGEKTGTRWVNVASITQIVEMPGEKCAVHFVGGSWIVTTETADVLLGRML